MQPAVSLVRKSLLQIILACSDSPVEQISHRAGHGRRMVCERERADLSVQDRKTKGVVDHRELLEAEELLNYSVGRSWRVDAVTGILGWSQGEKTR